MKPSLKKFLTTILALLLAFIIPFQTIVVSADFGGFRTSKTTTTNNGQVDFVKYINDINQGLLTQVLVEIDGNGNEVAYYTRGQELISQERNKDIFYYLYDGFMSVRALADNSGSITDTYEFDAWGNLISSTGSTVNSFLYRGEQFDQTTGLYYLRARYMNPNAGVFISMDTYQGRIFEPATLHKYLYAHANPVMNIDPSGYMTMGSMIANAGQVILSTIQTLNYTAILKGLIWYVNAIGVMFLTHQIQALIMDLTLSDMTILELLQNVCDEFISIFFAEHTKNARPSTKGKHEEGQTRKQKDKPGGEKGDSRRTPRKDPKK